MRAELLSAVRIIAREVAHFQGVFTSGMPVIYDHVPGIVNQVADALSRRFAQPCRRLDTALVIGIGYPPTCPPRDMDFYETDATAA